MVDTDLLEVSETRTLVRSGLARTIRERAGLSQGELARALGVSTATLSRWEARERIPRAEVAIRYGRILQALRPQVGRRGR